jgi:hypothetical protein
VHISRSEERVVDPDDVYSLGATGGETEARLRGRTPLVDIRPLGELLPSFEPLGLVPIHHRHAVNPNLVRGQLRNCGPGTAVGTAVGTAGRTTTELRTWTPGDHKNWVSFGEE